MAATKREAKRITFEGKDFDFFTNNDGYPQFDNYLLKSKANVLRFEYEGRFIEILTSKFPTGQYGCGYLIDNRIVVLYDELNGKCFATGIGGSKSFQSEFEAQVYIINYVLNHCLISDYFTKKIKEMLREYINPKTLF